MIKIRRPQTPSELARERRFITADIIAALQEPGMEYIRGDTRAPEHTHFIDIS
jgi:hypothetical protein